MNPQEYIVSNNNYAYNNLLISDLELQIVEKTESQEIEIFKQEIPDSSNEYKIEFIQKICFTLILLAIASPMIISDLYFGFTDKSCVDSLPDGEGNIISMKSYLLVSGFVNASAVVAFILNICSLSIANEKKSESTCWVHIGAVIFSLFDIMWNMLGAIAFWGTIYGEKICNKNVSTYIFVSLVIKLTCNLTSLLLSKSSEKD